MVETEIMIGDAECLVMTEIALESEAIQKQIKILSIVLGVCGFVMVVLGLKDIFQGLGILNVACFVLAVICFFLALGGEKMIFRSRMFKKTKEANAKVGTLSRKYVFSEEGVRISSEVSDSFVAWDVFEACGPKGHYFWLKRKDGQYALVNKDALSAEALDELKVLLAKNVPVFPQKLAEYQSRF